MHFHQTQTQVTNSKKRFRVLCCGRRWGKTTLSIEEIKGCAALRPGSRIAYIAPTYQQARDIAWASLLKELSHAGNVNETRLEIKLVNGSLIILRGWESIETLRGQMFDLIVLDEVAMMRDFWSTWQEIIRPTLTDRKGEALFISTPKGFNHFYDLFNLEHKDDDYKSFHFTTYDNPYIPVDEIEKAKKELTEDRFAQEYLADFRKTEGLVYKEFDRTKHVYSEIPDKRIPVKIFAGVDFGTHNPAAVLTIKKSPDAVYYLDDELYKSGMTDAQVSDFTASSSFNEVYPDPESASGILELERRNVNVREVIKNKDSIRNGINVVRELFKANRLFINARCKNTIFELETYSYPEKKPGLNEYENPIKDNDHAMDAMRYALSMESVIKNISNVSVYKPTYKSFNRR